MAGRWTGEARLSRAAVREEPQSMDVGCTMLRCDNADVI